MSGARMIVCAILAAGGSRRLGSPKQLVELRGRPLIAHAIAAAEGAALRTAVVLGAHRELVDAAIPPSTERLINDGWEEGMASSVRIAAAWARSVAAEALLLHLVDQPFVDAAHLERLVNEWRAGAPLVGSRYSRDTNVMGAPAIFSATYFAELEALKGERGAAPVLRAHANDASSVLGPAAALDIDTPQDLHHLRASSPNAPPRR